MIYMIRILPMIYSTGIRSNMDANMFIYLVINIRGIIDLIN